VREGQRFIVTVDEFELIERMVREGRLEARLLDFLRATIQTYPWFVLALAGLHTLEEMTRDYWHPLYGSVTPIAVGYLDPSAARRLIAEPTPDFDIDYGEDAIATILDLTHGQPYLVQLVCRELVTRLNRQVYEEGTHRERRFTVRDVKAVVDARDFYAQGDAYFTGVWQQAAAGEPLTQIDVLRVLSGAPQGLTVYGIADQGNLAPSEVARALEPLARHAVVEEREGRWAYAVELMRRWVEAR
jgi:hypothetical protein